MGCNCGKKNRQQKIQQQVQAARQRASATSSNKIKTSEYLKAQQQLAKKK